MEVVNLGYDNSVAAGRIVVIASASAAPMKRLVEESRKERRLIDVTCGRRTRAVVITDSGHIILSSVQPQTLAQRAQEVKEAKTYGVKRT